MILHHTGLLTQDIDAAREHLCAACGYTVVSDIITDPVQTARVQFLRLPGCQSFLELVTPEGEHSKLSAALKNKTPFHHLCYQTDDIEGDLARFRENGFLILCQPVPAAAFPGRRIAWVMDAFKNLFELVERGTDPDAVLLVK